MEAKTISLHDIAVKMNAIPQIEFGETPPPLGVELCMNARLPLHPRAPTFVFSPNLKVQERECFEPAMGSDAC